MPLAMLTLTERMPEDIAARALARVGDDFDPRRGAKSKLYRYAIWNHPIRSPLRARRSLWVRHPLDVGAMRRAAKALEGTHDFASFQAAGSDVVGTVRTLTRIEIEAVAETLPPTLLQKRASGAGACSGDLTLTVEGSGFLRYMVRNITGTLLEIGRGFRPEDDMPQVLAARDRARAGRTAPAHGLTLVSVEYREASSRPVASQPVEAAP